MKAFITRAIIVAQKKLYFDSLCKQAPHWTGQSAQDGIRNLLMADAPCMISRFGSGELEATLRHLDISAPGSLPCKWLRLVTGKMGPFWLDNSIRTGITWNAGLFPPTDEMISRFGEKMLADCQGVDILAIWATGEKRLHARFFPDAKFILFPDFDPFFASPPWSMALEGKTVLVIHPFESTIQAQYKKREFLFTDPRVLPVFNLKTYKSVQSIAGNQTGYATWFDALAQMCADISKIEFDIALIGAGAYGMPLGAHVKRLGKKAVHMGGMTQLLFGIKGGRWDHMPRFANTLYNPYWTRPLPEDRPKNYLTIEHGSYW